MSALARRVVRAHALQRVPVRAFRSPFAALNASSHLTAPPSTAAPVYEKQDDGSPEPHLSSSGTRTYVVSEPDPSNTPYHVPSGAYPTSAPYVIATHRDAGVGDSAAIRTVPGEMGRRGGSHDAISAVSFDPGKL